MKMYPSFGPVIPNVAWLKSSPVIPISIQPESSTPFAEYAITSVDEVVFELCIAICPYGDESISNTARAPVSAASVSKLSAAFPAYVVPPTIRSSAIVASSNVGAFVHDTFVPSVFKI